MKRISAVLGVCAVALAAGAVGAAGASTVGVVPPSQHVGGKSYAQWLTAFWEWELAHGHLTEAAPPGGLSCLPQAHSSKVWFLQDAFEGLNPPTVSCTIPAGRFLFLEGPGFECSTIEPAPYHAPRARLKTCASSFKLKGVQVSVDGTLLTQSAYTVATPIFHFVIPARDNVIKATGHTHGIGAAHADALMLRPLPPGPHTIVQVEHFVSGKTVQTTWQLTVG